LQEIYHSSLKISLSATQSEDIEARSYVQIFSVIQHDKQQALMLQVSLWKTVPQSWQLALSTGSITNTDCLFD